MPAEMWGKTLKFKSTRTGHIAWEVKKQDCHNQDKWESSGFWQQVNTSLQTHIPPICSSLCMMYILLFLQPSHYINSVEKKGFADRWTLWIMMISGPGHLTASNSTPKQWIQTQRGFTEIAFLVLKWWCYKNRIWGHICNDFLSLQPTDIPCSYNLLYSVCDVSSWIWAVHGRRGETGECITNSMQLFGMLSPDPLSQ